MSEFATDDELARRLRSLAASLEAIAVDVTAIAQILEPAPDDQGTCSGRGSR